MCKRQTVKSQLDMQSSDDSDTEVVLKGSRNRSPLKQAYAEIDFLRKPKYLKAAQKLLVSKDLVNLFQT